LFEIYQPKEHSVKFFSFLISAMLICLSAHAEDLSSWKLSYKNGGGGIWLQSPDENMQIGFLGYAQATQKVLISEPYRDRNTDYPLAFGVRRARFDTFATVNKMHTLFIEMDGAPTSSTKAGSEAGFALIEAHTTHKLLGDALSVRFGKFVIPFSSENARSSRAFDVVERHMVVNSFFSLPALDTQYGAMAMGKALDKNAFSWVLSAANGNGKGSSNIPENNTSKEITAHAYFDIYNNPAEHEQFTLGAAYDNDLESAQTMTLNDLAGGTYNSVAVSGVRSSAEADIYLVKGPFSMRGEYIDAEWNGSAGQPSIDGGFLQFAYFVTGSESDGGFQPLLRYEYAHLSGSNIKNPSADKLQAVIAGYQWFITSNVRHQFNLISTSPSGGAPGVYDGAQTSYAALSEFQVKF
jgi:phosphate-selective porin